ncbi:Methyltransferase domain-containing protein [Pustulibacterium marinum]|uniref:Methyltransferase domain-containing protein n=1 Tax=Pustulibacterium marinum TaxID=1224947 RepID=A0A1I7ETJ2_9FLAO|nr:class I SAM-dependent methyltransferase [Pustulibacterium marinum]SFU27208.1 Methyltransferase domain-containing protein [Pustulibacterium marinum]
MTKTSKVLLEVKDHSVSKETFQLVKNAEMDFLETIPQPAENELGKYYESEDYISHTDAKRSLFEKMYHVVKSYSLNKKVKLIDSFKTEKKTLLDIGAGTGDFLMQAKTKGWEVTGIEPNENAIANATKKGITLHTSLDKIANEKFNVITLWHVLEHLPNLENQIEQISSLLKPNGVLVIAVPNYKSYDAEYYKEFWAAYDVPRHLWHFSKEGIAQLFSKQNFGISKILPLIFDAFYVSLLSEKYKNGKMNYFKAFQIGMRSNSRAKATGEYSSLIYVLRRAK